MIDAILTYLPVTDPTWNFLAVLILILFAPTLFERLRVPSIVGLIFAGIIVGPHGIHLLDYDGAFETFGKVGLYYIMFLASLEMNLQDVSKDKWAAFGFGLLTFSIPFLLGTAVNYLTLGVSLTAALLIASMYASHTLLSYPIVMRYGLSQRRSVNLAVGGTIVADTITLLILAVIGGLFKEGVEGTFWLTLLAKVLLVSIVIIVVFPKVCRSFFRHYDDGVVQYIFVLVLVFLGAGLMEAVGMEGILGAFIVGIVLNRAIPTTSPLMSHIEFVGNALFIPYFLIGVGMIINIRVLFDGISGITAAVVMVCTAAAGKWLAAKAAQSFYNFSNHDRTLLFGLTNARAAATLAIMLVGSRIILPDGQALFSEAVINGTMLLILASCVLSSVATDRAARHIMQSKTSLTDTGIKRSSRMLVAIGHPEDSSVLINAALMMTGRKDSQLSAVSVITSDDPELRQESQKALNEAAKIAAAANVEIHTQCRLSVNTVTGMSHSVKELEATDILVALHKKRRISDSFFGRFTNDLLNATSQQIIIYRSLIPLNTLRKIHVVVPRKAEFEPGFQLWADRVAAMAQQLACRLDIYSGHDTLTALRQYWKKQHLQVHADYINYSTYETFQPLAANTRQDHMIVIIAARPGMPSHHQRYLNRLPEQLERYLSTRSLMIIYPSSLGMAESRPRMLAIK